MQQGLAQLLDRERLVKHPVHVAIAPCMRVSTHHMGRQRHDSPARLARPGLLLADAARGFVAIEFRHRKIHQDQIVILRLRAPPGLEPVFDEIGNESEPRQRSARHLPVDRAVIRDEHP